MEVRDVAEHYWPGLHLVEPITEGNRNEVWRGELAGRDVAVRQSRRSPDSLAWELDLVGFLADHGFWVPKVVATAEGQSSARGVVVQEWLHGEPPRSEQDWAVVAHELQRLHALTVDYPQRPGCCAVAELVQHRRSVDADLDQVPADVVTQLAEIFAAVEGRPTVVVHGDPMDSNIRIDPVGRIGLLDWDESRVDVAWHDLSNLGTQVLDNADHAAAIRLSNAWEAANGWVAEPAYARRRFEAL